MSNNCIGYVFREENEQIHLEDFIKTVNDSVEFNVKDYKVISDKPFLLTLKDEEGNIVNDFGGVRALGIYLFLIKYKNINFQCVIAFEDNKPGFINEFSHCFNFYEINNETNLKYLKGNTGINLSLNSNNETIEFMRNLLKLFGGILKSSEYNDSIEFIDKNYSV